MIILYDEDERSFSSLGIGVLSDVSSCIIIEELNGAFELEMEYPITGAHYKDIKEKRLILAPPNEFVQSQPFRIYKITRPIDGMVTIYAEHISYDTLRIPVKAVNGENLTEVFEQIQNRTLIDSSFKLIIGDDRNENDSNVSFKTTVPYPMRSILTGEEGIVNMYGGDLTFDRFNITLNNRRGKDRDFTIRYSKNMLDIEHETTSELIYNGVCPYYNSTTTETKTAMTKKYKEVYLSNTSSNVVLEKDPITGETIYPAEWLSYNDNGSGLPEILTLAISNIIATEGAFYNHIVHAKKVTPLNKEDEDEYFYDVTYNMAYIDKGYTNEFGEAWLYKDEELTQVYEPKNLEWNPQGLPTKKPSDDSAWWNPELNKDKIFRIFNDLDKMYKIYLWKKGTDGLCRYVEASSEDNVEEYAPSMVNVSTESEEKANIITYEGDIVYINEIRAQVAAGSLEYSVNWLEELEETEETARWKVKGSITPKENVNYKVITEENVIVAYSIEGSTNYSKTWLTLTEGGTEPLTPIDGQAYEVHKVENGKDTGNKYYYRWYESQNLYDLMGNSKFTYKNYIWNGNSYVERNSINDRILTIDLTDKFDDTPTNDAKFQKKLYDTTVEYYKENKLGELKDSLKVSFVKLSTSSEYSKWKDLEHVELGDTVHVVYEELGINVIKKVTKTEYNVVTNSYESIELGEKSTNFVNSAIIEGDNISSLTNDKNYADILTVTSLVAQRITADFIKSVTAEITEAQIKQLTSESITAALIEAERFEIDKLVAGLLVADNALVREQLTVGSGLIVNGEVNIKSGSISISGEDRISNAINAYIYDSENEYEFEWLKSLPTSTEPLIPDPNKVYKVYDEDELLLGYFKYSTETYKYEQYIIDPDIKFQVDDNGNVYANSLEIAGGSIYISNEDETITFEVDNEGNVYANSVDLTGKITANEGSIGGCEIIDGVLHVNSANIDSINADEVKISGTFTAIDIQLGEYLDGDTKKYHFIADSDGNVYADSLELYGGSIRISNETEGTIFEVDYEGNVYANSLELDGGSINIKTYTVSVVPNDTVEAYTSKWLVSADTGEDIIPEQYVNYKTEGYTVNVTFGTEGNYRTVLADNMNSLVESVDYADNATTNTQFKNNCEIKIPVEYGGYIILKGFSGYSLYSVTINGVTHTELTGTYQSETAKYAQDIIIKSMDSKNYYISLIIKTEEDQMFNWNGEKYVATYPVESTFEVDKYGNLTANNVDLKGKITATSGLIGDCEIIGGVLHVNSANIDYINANDVTLSGTFTGISIQIGEIEDANGKGTGVYNFEVNETGDVTILNGDINIKSGSIQIGEILDDSGVGTGAYNFEVDNTGNVYISNGVIDLGNGVFRVENNGHLTAASLSLSDGKLLNLETVGTDSLTVLNLIEAKDGVMDVSGVVDFRTTTTFYDGFYLENVHITLDNSTDYIYEERDISWSYLKSYDETRNVTIVVFTISIDDRTVDDYGIVQIEAYGYLECANCYDIKGGNYIGSKQIWLPTYNQQLINLDVSKGKITFTVEKSGYYLAVTNDKNIDITEKINVKVKNSDSSNSYISIPNGILTPNIGTSYNYIDNVYVENIYSNYLYCDEFRVNSRLQYQVYATRLTVKKYGFCEVMYSTIQSEIGGVKLTSGNIIAAVASKVHPSLTSEEYEERNLAVYIHTYDVEVYNPSSHDMDVFLIIVYK